MREEAGRLHDNPAMNEHQRRVLSRVADEIHRYRDGRVSAVSAFNNIWGLFEAAGLPEGATRDQFLELYYAATTADDARQPWMPAGLGTDAEFDAALTRLQQWARAVRDVEAADSGP
jgi:hypothetical protein